MRLIVADVGGTNARLAFQKNFNSEISLIENFLDFVSYEKGLSKIYFFAFCSLYWFTV